MLLQVLDLGKKKLCQRWAQTTPLLHHKYYLTMAQHRNETNFMKFIAFFPFVATVRATRIYLALHLLRLLYWKPSTINNFNLRKVAATTRLYTHQAINNLKFDVQLKKVLCRRTCTRSCTYAARNSAHWSNMLLSAKKPYSLTFFFKYL